VKTSSARARAEDENGEGLDIHQTGRCVDLLVTPREGRGEAVKGCASAEGKLTSPETDHLLWAEA
jgi:hypothetical protein